MNYLSAYTRELSNPEILANKNDSVWQELTFALLNKKNMESVFDGMTTICHGETVQDLADICNDKGWIEIKFPNISQANMKRNLGNVLFDTSQHQILHVNGAVIRLVTRYSRDKFTTAAELVEQWARDHGVVFAWHKDQEPVGDDIHAFGVAFFPKEHRLAVIELVDPLCDMAFAAANKCKDTCGEKGFNAWENGVYDKLKDMIMGKKSMNKVCIRQLLKSGNENDIDLFASDVQKRCGISTDYVEQ